VGDFNAKVGNNVQVDGLVGKHGLGNYNERGHRLIDFCTENSMTITNTMFQHHPRQKYTWISVTPDDNSNSSSSSSSRVGFNVSPNTL